MPIKQYIAYRNAVDAENQQRIASHQASVAAVAPGANPLNLIADGDSWFDYPLGGAIPLVDHTDVIAQLRTALKPGSLLLSLAHAGDATTTILGATKRQVFAAALADPAHGTFDAILFSAGGDDLVGEQFRFWLRDAAKADNDPAHAIDAVALAGVLTVIKAGYLDLVALRNKTLGPNAPIFVHAYDFALPDGRGACTLGPWLLPSLADRGWMAADAPPSAADLARAAGIVRDMLTQFHHMMADLEADPANNIVYVRTQGILAADAGFQNDWANELHPTPPGFARVAARFVEALEARFPGQAQPATA